MDDLISRQAILKNIEKIRQGVRMMDDTHRASIIMNGMYLCEKAVRNQPSAQQKIIRCKDCVRWDFPGYCVDFMTQDENGFCSWAERREE